MKFNKTYILIILVIIVAGVFLNKLLVSNYQLEEKRIEDRLLKHRNLIRILGNELILGYLFSPL